MAFNQSIFTGTFSIVFVCDKPIKNEDNVKLTCTITKIIFIQTNAENYINISTNVMKNHPLSIIK